MAAQLTDHPWGMEELLRYPVYPAADSTQTKKIRTYKEVLDRLKGVWPVMAAA
jgi:hypothetical protein